jgi:hypothetical protein
MSTVSTCPPAVPMIYLWGAWRDGKAEVTTHPVIAIQTTIGEDGDPWSDPLIWHPTYRRLFAISEELAVKERVAFDMVVDPTGRDLEDAIADLLRRIDELMAPQADPESN